MKQFLLPSAPEGDGCLTITGRDFHYLARVRRLAEGARLECRDPDGRILAMAVERVGDKDLVLRMLAESAAPVLPSSFRIHLVQGLPKGAKTDQIIRQACEAGVHSITLIPTDHSVARLAESGASRLDRWQRIAREAFQQSGSSSLAQVKLSDSLDSWLANSCLVQEDKDSIVLYCHETALEQGTIHRYCSSGPAEIFVLVGPEGGLSPRECRLLADAGAHPVHLGASILRTETAAVFAIAAIQVIMWEANSWAPKPL